MRCDHWMEIERGGKSLEINVEYDATPIVSATYWQPAEGGEIEMLACFLDGVAIDPPLSEAEWELVEADVIKHHDDSVFDYDPDWDREYDQKRDDRLTGGNA